MIINGQVTKIEAGGETPDIAAYNKSYSTTAGSALSRYRLQTSTPRADINASLTTMLSAYPDGAYEVTYFVAAMETASKIAVLKKETAIVTIANGVISIDGEVTNVSALMYVSGSGDRPMETYTPILSITKTA